MMVKPIACVTLTSLWLALLPVPLLATQGFPLPMMGFNSAALAC
jgi:hypothetical protein|eukprot:COSAG01_NODE_4120_length_5332_cov_18.963310_8_plen_44_part_00